MAEEKKGFIFPLDSVALNKPTTTLIAALARPVQFAKGDINGDGQDDMVVAEFGNHTGKLSWFDGADPKKKKTFAATAASGLSSSLFSAAFGLPSLISSAIAVVPNAVKSLPMTSDQREIDSAQSLISNQGVNMPGV